MKVGIVGEIHPNGFEIFDNNKIEYFVTTNTEEDYLIKKLGDVDGIIVRTAELNKNIRDDAISAIVNLGYSKSDVFLVVNSICNEIDNDEKLSIEKIIPLALKKLSK